MTSHPVGRNGGEESLFHAACGWPYADIGIMRIMPKSGLCRTGRRFCVEAPKSAWHVGIISSKLHEGFDGCPSGLPSVSRSETLERTVGFGRRLARRGKSAAIWGTAAVALTHAGRQLVTQLGHGQVAAEIAESDGRQRS